MKDKKILEERITKRAEKIARLQSNIEKLHAKAAKIASLGLDEREKRFELSCVAGDIEDKVDILPMPKGRGFSDRS